MILLLAERKSPRPPSKRIHFIPAIEVRTLNWKPPKRVFDFVLVTSRHAFSGQKNWPQARQYVAIGKATAESLRACPYPIKVLTDSSSRGFLKFFRTQKKSRIFFPRSKIADPHTVRLLRKMGHQVLVRHAYETRLLTLRAHSRKILSAETRAILLSSPSCFQALQKSFGSRRLRSLAVRWVVNGPTSFEYLKKRVESKILVARKPGWKEMYRAFLTSQKKASK